MTAPGGAPDLEALVPQVAWERLIADALSAPAYRTLVGSGLIVTLALAGRLALAMLRAQAGEQPQWLRPLGTVLVYLMLLVYYEPLVVVTLRGVTALGTGDTGMVGIDVLFQQRRQALTQAFAASQPEARSWLLTVDGLSVVLLQVLTEFVGMLAHAVCITVRCVQILLLAVLVQTGPLLLGFSLLGGPLAALGRNWWLALVEVSAWSWLQDSVLRVFVRLVEVMPEPPSLVHELTLSIVLMAVLVAVPALSALLIRGHAAAGIGQAAGAAAASFALARAAALSRLAPKPMVGQGRAALEMLRDQRRQRRMPP